eukprot:Hpha_TRINITY_DN11578_c0_g1::TRINITY_DN11578_c0_g1_i1::g.32329::m.32329
MAHRDCSERLATVAQDCTTRQTNLTGHWGEWVSLDVESNAEAVVAFRCSAPQVVYPHWPSASEAARHAPPVWPAGGVTAETRASRGSSERETYSAFRSQALRPRPERRQVEKTKEACWHRAQCSNAPT